MAQNKHCSPATTSDPRLRQRIEKPSTLTQRSDEYEFNGKEEYLTGVGKKVRPAVNSTLSQFPQSCHTLPLSASWFTRAVRVLFLKRRQAVLLPGVLPRDSYRMSVRRQCLSTFLQ